jgi:predicted aspartyl protease
LGEFVPYNKFVYLCIALVIATSSMASASDSTDGETGRISFRLYQGYLIVAQGSLGKLKKKNLLIDTGANPTVLDERIAQQLGVKPLSEPGSAMGLVSGTVREHSAVLSSLQLGPLHAKDLRVAVADLSELNSKVGTRVDAIVGVDVLGQSSFRIDYERKEVVFGPVDFDHAAVFEGGDGVFATVPVTVGERSLRVMVDTGSAGVVLFANRIGEWRSRFPLAGLARMTGLGGATPLPVVRLPRLRVGVQELGPRNAYLARESTCCSFDGVIGVSALRVKQIGFDFAHHTLSWQLRDGEIPSMSESAPANCMPASAPGLTTPGQASMFSGATRAASCSSPGD